MVYPPPLNELGERSPNDVSFFIMHACTEAESTPTQTHTRRDSFVRLRYRVKQPRIMTTVGTETLLPRPDQNHPTFVLIRH
jgi:hypothetical protein